LAAAYDQGLMKFDPASGIFQRVLRDSVNIAVDVMKDKVGKLWISTETDGLVVLILGPANPAIPA